MTRSTFVGALSLVGWMLAGMHEPTQTAFAQAESAHFVGEGRCGAPTCHGAGLPSTEAAKRDWRPWKSSRTQWNTSNIDHHSRAYRTLESEGGKAIAAYMGIRATESEKCLSCHAPDAPASPDMRKEGVTCEHCHGPAEFWLKPHVERDWKDKRAQYFTRGFYDNNNLVLRARKCASCHVEIDHEIVAGGHPPLQFDLVAYAQIMKHWDDQDELPPGSFSIDPTLWAVGQVTGLRHALAMLSERAGNANYQSIGKVSHFQSANCYQCHHKLVDDALRQASGHYAMVEAIFATMFPDQAGALTGIWNGVSAAAGTSAEQARERASSADSWLAPYQERIVDRGVNRDATRKILARITGSGETLKRVERFFFNRSATGNTVRVGSVSAPWWWTTGAPEQTVLAIESLCEPAFERKSCMAPGSAIEKDMRQLLNTVDRFDYRPDQFSQTLSGINAKLFH